MLHLPPNHRADSNEDKMTALFIPSVKAAIGKEIAAVAEVADAGWANVERPELNLELPMFVACVKMHPDPAETTTAVATGTMALCFKGC